MRLMKLPKAGKTVKAVTRFGGKRQRGRPLPTRARPARAGNCTPSRRPRHAYAMTMLGVGMTPGCCARQLGHSVQTFLHIYARQIAAASMARRITR